MDIRRRIDEAHDLTPTERQLGQTALTMGERMQGTSIKEFAQAANVSVASIHRFCKKLGLEGFKELKIELARAAERRDRTASSDVDINFPFEPNSSPTEIMGRMERLYETTLSETRDLLDAAQVDHAAKLVTAARQVDLYTCSHNLHPAHMFRDRLLSAGKPATCYDDIESQIRTILASDETHVAIVISYSGLAPNLKTLLPLLADRHVPVVIIGTPRCARLHPGFAAYLTVSDIESISHRITQFASHIAVQYVLDTLYSCFFARDYARSMAFLESTFPYTRLPGVK